jgi:hypothetical protein
LDLAAVHKFYMQLLERNMGHPVPVPKEASAPDSNADKVEQSIVIMNRWLRLCDMAITSHMMRDELQQHDPGHETVEALLRHYIVKASPIDVDRDKTDFLATWALRNPSPWSKRLGKTAYAGDSYSYVHSKEQAQSFEVDLKQIVGTEPPPLAEEQIQLMREFQYLQQEVDDFRHFDQLMDSGIMARVKELKHKFGAAFYHPTVLSLVAVYNAFFGKRFDDLFKDAATQIKAFATKVQQEGGSIMARVDGDVTVKHLADVHEGHILKQEYGRAQEHFQKVSKFKKAVDSRRSARIAGAPAPAAAASAAGGPAARGTTGVHGGVHSGVHNNAAQQTKVSSLAEAPIRNQALQIEETKVRGVVESIRNFVRSNDGKTSPNIVPLRNGNLVLTPAELEAFKAEYPITEKSFRAELSNNLTFTVALHNRMQNEMDDYKAKRDSTHLWRQHAESLNHMISLAIRTVEESKAVIATAQQRGLDDKVKGLQFAQEKMRMQMQLVNQTLQS